MFDDTPISDWTCLSEPYHTRGEYTVEFMNNIKEIYESRNILKAMVVKNLFGHYRSSALGFAWHFIVPAIMMFVYYIVFTQIRSNPIPEFWIFLASGLFPFNFMTSNLSGGSGCIVGNSGMVKKMYLPREIIVLAQVISTFIVMLIGYSIILVAIIISGYSITWTLSILPLIMMVMLVFVTGYVLILSSITVYVRDVQHLIGSITMIFFFMTPMYFTMDSVTGLLATLVRINPFSYFVESYHQIVYYGSVPEVKIIAMCLIIATLSLTIGIITFTKLKKGFVERL